MTDDTRNDGREHESEARDALDRAISAAMDDALPPGEHAALRERIAAEPDVAARVRAFHAVDAAIRDLAESDPAAAAREGAGLADLQARIGASRPGGLRPWAPAAALLAAAAAALLLMRGADRPSGSDPGPPTPLAGPAPERGRPDAGSAPGDGLDAPLDERLQEEISVALGYGEEGEKGEEVEVIPDVRIEDFEVVDRLELLEFLAEQDREGQG